MNSRVVFRGQLHGVVLILHLSEQVICRAVFLEMPFRCHKVIDDVVPGAVLTKRFPKELLHPIATDATRCFLADTKIGPDRGPVAWIARIIQQAIDQLLTFELIFVRQKLFDILQWGNMSDDVQMHPPNPLGIIRDRGRLHFIVGPG